MPYIRYNVHLSRQQIEKMRRLYARDGIKPAEQVRRALDQWLKLKAKGLRKTR